jgi:hypothetical protein
MKQIFRNSIHKSEKSHECLIAELNGKKIKITYEAYNAVERCNTEIFDGFKWNHCISMLDMGVTPETSAYNIWDENKREKRANELFKISVNICRGIL